MRFSFIKCSLLIYKILFIGSYLKAYPNEKNDFLIFLADSLFKIDSNDLSSNINADKTKLGRFNHVNFFKKLYDEFNAGNTNVPEFI